MAARFCPDCAKFCRGNGLVVPEAKAYKGTLKEHEKGVIKSK